MDIKTIKSREKIFEPLWARMDRDKELIYNYPFILRDYRSKGRKPIPEAYSVTRPLAPKDYNKYNNKLIALKRKIKVHSDDVEFDEGKIIQFCQDSDFSVDEVLASRMAQPARATHNAFICSRGWVAEQTLWTYDGKLKTDSRPIDPRWLMWDTDGEQLSWACAIFYRYPEDINGEYDEGFTGNELLKVMDCWTPESNVVYVKELQVHEQDNPYKDGDGRPYVPFVIQPAPYGPIMGDEDNIEHLGESIFYPQRDTYDEANFAASIAKTLAREGLRPPYQTKGKGPKQYPGSGDIAEQQEEPLEPIQRPDMTNAMRNYQGITDTDIQSNAFARTDFGSVSSPMSGDAIDALGRGGAEVLNSRIQGLRSFDARVYRQRIDQFIQFGKKLNVGRSRKHSPSQLEGDYEISVHYIDTSLEAYARRGAAAATMIGQMPERWIRSEIIMADDPDKVDELVDMEETERVYPIVNMIDRTLDFIRQDTAEANAKAWALAKQTISMIRQQSLGNEVSPKEQREPSPLVNMSTQRTAGNA